jgi:hypothetical protein
LIQAVKEKPSYLLQYTESFNRDIDLRCIYAAKPPLNQTAMTPMTVTDRPRFAPPRASLEEILCCRAPALEEDSMRNVHLPPFF